MMERAQGRAIVTGPASGMGEAVARRMAADGWPLLLCDISEDALADKAREMSATTDVRTLAGDLSLPETAGRILVELGDEQVGALVHCAGLSTGMATAARILEVNLAGTIRLVDALRDRMAQGSAAVLFGTMVGPGPLDEFLSTMRTVDDVPRLLEHIAEPQEHASGRAYVGSKRAVQLLVQREAQAFGARGARIVSLSPGIIDTPMSRAEQERFPMMADMVAATPLGRPGRAEEIAAVVAFLCSPEASFVSGIDIFVDGGQVAKRRTEGETFAAG